MNKKSIYNALMAAGYITLVASGMNLIGNMTNQPEDNVFMPIAALSVLVLSVAIMAYLFFYQPVLLLLDGKRPEAIKLFLGTIWIFAILAIIFMVLAMFVIPYLVG